MENFKKTLKGMLKVYAHEFSLVMHDAGIVLFFTFLPLVYPIIYSLIYNPEVVRDVPMVVVDHDRTPLSRDLVRKLDACQGVWVKGYAADLNEARRAMDSKEVFSILEIPEGFNRKVGRGETGPCTLYCDMTLLLRYRSTLVASTDVMQEMGAEIQTETLDRVAPLASTVTAGGDLLPINNISLGNPKSGFDSFIMPVVLVLILHQCIVLAVGMAGGAKRENPRLIGYNPDNTTRSVLGTMIAQMLCYATILLLPIFFTLHYVPLIFRFPMQGLFWQELVFMLPMFLACFGIGFTFQAFVTERESVFVSWVVTSLVLLLLSGAIWPLYDMPPVWRWLAQICPSTWGVEGFIKMESDGARLWQLKDIYIHLWILAVVWWVIGYCAQKWFVRPAIAHSRLRVISDYKARIAAKKDNSASGVKR